MNTEEPLVYKIFGTTAQVLEISIEPTKTLIADGGLLLYLDEEITHETMPDDGYEPPKEEAPKATEEEEGFLDEPEIDDEADLLPEIVNLPTKPAKREEEEETESSFLEKLWKATRKTIGQIGQKIQDSTSKKTKEEAPEVAPPPSFGGIFEEPAPIIEPIPVIAPLEPIFSWFLTHLNNPSEYIRKVGFTTTHGGLVVPIMLDELKDNTIVFQTGAFLCARKGIQLEKFLDTGVSVNFTQGKLFKLDKISGNGMIFLRGEGQIIEKEMENDAIRLNLFSLLAYESSLTLDTNKLQLIDAMNYEDQTQFTLLSGSGRYWLQTANLQHLVYRLSPVVFEAAVEEQKPPIVEQQEEEQPEEKLLVLDGVNSDDEPPLDIDKIVDEL